MGTGRSAKTFASTCACCHPVAPSCIVNGNHAANNRTHLLRCDLCGCQLGASHTADSHQARHLITLTLLIYNGEDKGCERQEEHVETVQDAGWACVVVTLKVDHVNWHVKPPVRSEATRKLNCTFLKVNLYDPWDEMSQTNQATPPNLTEGHLINLTLVVLLLIPCVVVLLLLNCFFLGYKFLILSKTRQRRDDTEELLLQSTLQRVRRIPDVVFSPLQDGRRAYMSLSEPVLPHPVTSSRASSRERAGMEHRMRLLRPDGATGSGSLRAPSTIRAASLAAGFSPRLDLPPGSRTYNVRAAGWCRSAPVLTQSSDSEAEARVNLVPPNSPTVSTKETSSRFARFV